MARYRLLASVLVSTSLLAACGGDKQAEEGTPAKSLTAVAASTLPSTILGLNVTPEKVTKATTKEARRTYFDQVSLFGLRRGKVVMATLQVGHLGPDPRYVTSDFRNDLVYQLAGGGTPNTIIIGDDTVYLTRGTKQSLAVWFHGRYEYLLSIREDYRTPRRLIREALAVTR